MRKKSFGVVFVAVLLSVGVMAEASQLTGDQVNAILNLLKSFNADTATVANVQVALTGVGTSTPSGLSGGQINKVFMLGHMLRQGVTGEEVKLLQTILAADPDVYPEGMVTGTFGPLTAKAVSKFQKKHGLDQVGFVGPKTLQRLNKVLGENPLDEEEDNDDDKDGRKKRFCAKVPPGHLIAPGWLRKHNGERPIVPPCQKLPSGIGNHMGTSTPPQVSSFNFSISNDGSKTVMRERNATSTIVATMTAGTSTRPVAFAVSGLPSGVSAWFTQTTCSPTCTSLLVIHASSTAAVATSTISVTASSTPLLRSTSFLFGVRATTTSSQ